MNPSMGAEHTNSKHKDKKNSPKNAQSEVKVLITLQRLLRLQIYLVSSFRTPFVPWQLKLKFSV